MSHRFKKSLVYSTIASAIAAGTISTVFAETTTLDEVVVTAQRRSEASRDVPISVTAISAEQLETANVVNLSDTAKLTPGLRFDSQGPGVQPTIRGVGTAVTTSGGGPNVGVYVDGFFNSNTYVTDFQLMKVQNIQVLKGPQGTLFGRNTTGGAILVTTAEPSTNGGVEAKVSYENYNAVTAQGYGTFGITDKVAMDMEVLYRSGDGYFTNILDGDEKIGQYENWSARMGLKFDLSDSVSLLLRYTHAEKDDPTPELVNAFVDDSSGTAGFFSQISSGGRAIYGKQNSANQPLVYFYAPFAATVPYAKEPGEIALNKPISFNVESDIIQATVKADLGFAELTSYTQYREDDTPYYGDLDATNVPIFNILVAPLDTSFSQEFLLNSKGESALQWTAGLNYYQIRDTWDVGASFGGAPFIAYGGSTTNTVSYAAFLDGTYQFNDSWFVTVGGRYSHDLVKDASFKTNPFTTFYTGPNGETIPFSGASGTVIPVNDLEDDAFTPRVVLRYKPSDDSSTYVSYTQGYKAGILNVGGLSQKPVEPEDIDAYEVGYKFDNHTVAVDLAGFYYDYKNLQVSSFQNGAAQIRNASSSEIYGFEAQLRYQISRDFNINAGAAYTHARYKDFPQAPYYSYCDPLATIGSPLWCVTPAFGGLGAGALVQLLTDASGGEMQRSPELTGNVGASYDVHLGNGLLRFSGNWYYTSSFYFDPHQQFKQESYNLLSLRAQWTDSSERFTLAVYGDNLTDEEYQTQVLPNTLGVGSVWGPPITYGITAGVKF